MNMVTPETLKQISDAEQQVITSLPTIWNARLEALVNAGDFGVGLKEMISPLEVAGKKPSKPKPKPGTGTTVNNCTCTNHCQPAKQVAAAGLSSAVHAVA
jgi:hypothetical protein